MECRSTIQPSPEDILPIDRREEEEGAQSALMNAEPRGPYSVHLRPATSFPPSLLPLPLEETPPSGWTILWGLPGAGYPETSLVILNFRGKSEIFFPPLFRGADNYGQ